MFLSRKEAKKDVDRLPEGHGFKASRPKASTASGVMGPVENDVVATLKAALKRRGDKPFADRDLAKGEALGKDFRGLDGQ
jgi:hypothetical protein